MWLHTYVWLGVVVRFKRVGLGVVGGLVVLALNGCVLAPEGATYVDVDDSELFSFDVTALDTLKAISVAEAEVFEHSGVYASLEDLVASGDVVVPGGVFADVRNNNPAYYAVVVNWEGSIFFNASTWDFHPLKFDSLEDLKAWEPNVSNFGNVDIVDHVSALIVDKFENAEQAFYAVNGRYGSVEEVERFALTDESLPQFVAPSRNSSAGVFVSFNDSEFIVVAVDSWSNVSAFGGVNGSDAGSTSSVSWKEGLKGYRQSVADGESSKDVFPLITDLPLPVIG